VATSETEVVNRALDHLKAAPILDLGEDTERARLMARAFPTTRDAVLRHYPWNCARRRTKLAADAAAPAFDYGRQFPLPEGPDPLRCLRVLRVGEWPDHTRWRVEGRMLLCDEAGPLPIEYIGRLIDVAQWDALLEDAVALKLAADTAWNVTGSESRGEVLLAAYARALILARRADAREQSQDEEVIADRYTTARL
jgi:hypothetical protein